MISWSLRRGWKYSPQRALHVQRYCRQSFLFWFLSYSFQDIERLLATPRLWEESTKELENQLMSSYFYKLLQNWNFRVTVLGMLRSILRASHACACRRTMLPLPLPLVQLQTCHNLMFWVLYIHCILITTMPRWNHCACMQCGPILFFKMRTQFWVQWALNGDLFRQK